MILLRDLFSSVMSNVNNERFILTGLIYFSA
jgi:hypothetical protein